MIYSSLVLIPILLFVFTQVFLLGKYFSVVQGVFKGNGFARFIIGTLLYFGLTFIILFPFI